MILDGYFDFFVNCIGIFGELDFERYLNIWCGFCDLFRFLYNVGCCDFKSYLGNWCVICILKLLEFVGVDFCLWCKFECVGSVCFCCIFEIELIFILNFVIVR